MNVRQSDKIVFFYHGCLIKKTIQSKSDHQDEKKQNNFINSVFIVFDMSK